jgi:hypothetical protein
MFIEKRNPDYIIISSLWYRRFFMENIAPSSDGKKIPDRALKLNLHLKEILLGTF